MFHIFRWCRRRKPDKKTTSDSSVNGQHQKYHARRYFLRIWHGNQSRLNLSFSKRHRSSFDSKKHQVAIS